MVKDENSKVLSVSMMLSDGMGASVDSIGIRTPQQMEELQEIGRRIKNLKEEIGVN